MNQLLQQETTRNLKSTTTALFMIFLLLLGCSRGKSGSNRPAPLANRNSSSSDNITPPHPRSTITFTPSDNASKDLADAMRRLETAYPYRMTETVFDPNKPPNEYVFEFATAERLHVRGAGIEWIKTGKYDGFSKWKDEWSRDPNYTNYGEDTANRTLRSLASEQREVKPNGKETVNGVPCYVYQHKIGKSGTGTGKTWIGAADGLPHQIDRVFGVSKEHFVFEYVDVVVKNPIP